MDQPSDALMQRATEVQAGLVERLGQETVTTMLDAVGEQGFPQEFLRNVVTSPNAVADFETLGTESLLRRMQQGKPNDSATRAAELAHAKIRERQRQAWRTSKARR